MSYQQWQEMFEAQGRKCKLCGSSDAGSERGWHTDHITRAGRIVVRGILCQPCNLALGFYERDRSKFATFEAYLANSRE
jgi:sulfur relay (sulfurtransferase) complex TusBCD TusD component (DsrE family)